MHTLHTPQNWGGFRGWWDPCFEDDRVRALMNSMKGSFTPIDTTLAIANSIIHALGGVHRYCAIHIRRGDKVRLRVGGDLCVCGTTFLWLHCMWGVLFGVAL